MNPNIHRSDDLDMENNIYQFATYIGIDPNTEDYLLDIAEEGYLSSTPEPWVQCMDSDNKPYYYNEKTNEIMRDTHPKIELYKSRVEQERIKQGGNYRGYNQLGDIPNNPFGPKKDDPLLVMEKAKRMKEKKNELENTYNNVKEEIDEAFEKKKKEILMMHQQEVDREKQRLQLNEDQEIHHLKLSVRNIHLISFRTLLVKLNFIQLEEEYENQLDKLKSDISKQEQREKSKIKAENLAKLKSLAESYERKLEKEYTKQDQEFKHTLKRIDANEKRKADLEIEKYKTEQRQKLEDRLVNITDQKDEKDRLQKEFTSRYNMLKIEYQKKVEQEKKELQGTRPILKFRPNPQ